jgi:hypothetical protein
VRAASLPRLVVSTLAWLPLMFAVWYFAAPILLFPAALLAEGALRTLFPELVRDVSQHAAVVEMLTKLRPGQTTNAAFITVDVDMLLYAFGLPMFAALVVAAREIRWPRVLVIGYLATLPVVAWGVVADFLKTVAVTAGPHVASQAGFGAPTREVIVFAYQFGTLILPTVIPALVWVLTHRALLERLRAASPSPTTPA